MTTMYLAELCPLDKVFKQNDKNIILFKDEVDALDPSAFEEVGFLDKNGVPIEGEIELSSYQICNNKLWGYIKTDLDLKALYPDGMRLEVAVEYKGTCLICGKSNCNCSHPIYKATPKFYDILPASISNSLAELPPDWETQNYESLFEYQNEGYKIIDATLDYTYLDD